MLSQGLGLLEKGILMIFDGGIFLVDKSDNLVFLDLRLFFHELNFAVKFLDFSLKFINKLNFIFFHQFNLLFPLLLLLVDLHLAIATDLLEQLLPVLVEGGDFDFELLLEELLLLAEGLLQLLDLLL
jgi:hypothetical protein